MFIRGVHEPREYSRQDDSIYKGIVVKNNDPLKMYRVKIYIPELSNQPLEDWLNKYSNFNMRFPGKNNKTDSWSDTKMFEELSELLPWAEPCFPPFGEGSPARYDSVNEIATISDTNYEDGFQTNNTEPPTMEKGAVAPSYFYEHYATALGDSFTSPMDNLCNNNNPYSFLGRPSGHSNKAKGLFSVPSVGTKVWLFHYEGDVNFPVYFGIRHDYRETSLINNLEQPGADIQSLDYPGMFENSKKQER